jgi:hypothetical protein
LNIQDDFSRFGIFIPVSHLTSSTTASHLLFNVMLQYGRPKIIRSDRGPAFTGEIIQWIAEVEGA